MGVDWLTMKECIHSWKEGGREGGREVRREVGGREGGRKGGRESSAGVDSNSSMECSRKH